MAWERIYVAGEGDPPAHRPARVDVTDEELVVRWNGQLRRILLERITSVSEEGSWYASWAERPTFVRIHYRAEDDAPAVLHLTCWQCTASLISAILTARARKLARAQATW